MAWKKTHNNWFEIDIVLVSQLSKNEENLRGYPEFLYNYNFPVSWKEFAEVSAKSNDSLPLVLDLSTHEETVAKHLLL